MRRRLLATMLSITTLAVIGFGAPLAFVIERFVEENATSTVERAAVLATRDVSTTFATDGDPVELPGNADGIVFGLYDPAGVLVTGKGPNPADDITRAALGNAVVDGEVDGQLIVAVPVAADERVVGVVRASRPTNASDSRTTTILLLLSALGVGVIAISGFIAWVLAGRVSRPVGRLRDAARQLGDGDFGVHVPTSTIPELDEAGRAMNATAQRLGELVGRERAFSADASHQLRTPIAGMRAAVETELEFPRDDPAEVLREMASDLDRLERTVTELLAIARADDSTETVDLVAVVADLEATWLGRLRQEGRTLQTGPVRYQPAALANAAMLRHALDVLVDNALGHGEGSVSVTVTSTTDSVTIGVADEGTGFDADGRRGTSPADGHGLGLPLAQRLVDAMGGRLLIAESGPHPRVEIVLRRAPSV